MPPEAPPPPRGSLAERLTGTAVLRRDLAAAQAALDATQTQVAELQTQVAAMGKALERVTAGQTIYLGDHEALTWLHTGQRIYVDTRDLGICAHLMTAGRWEGWVERALARLVRPGMRFADVGANFGYYTLLGARWVGATGQVFAFEANPAIAAKLRKSITVNGYTGRVRLFAVAAHDAAARLRFTFSHELSGGGSLADGATEGFATHAIEVPAARIDDLLAEVPAIDVMKFDVEGAEPAALAGAAALIARSPTVALVVEFHAGTVGAEHGGALPFLRRFAQDGFSLALIEPEGTTGRLSAEAVLDRLGPKLGYLLLRRG